MLLAIITGQRLADICNMKFSDVEDNYLHRTKQNRGKIALPLHLKCYQLV
jgi:integrase